MYSPKIDPELISRLYHLRETRLSKGEKGVTMTKLVKEALMGYLPKQEQNLMKENLPFKKDWRVKLEEKIRDKEKRLNKRIY